MQVRKIYFFSSLTEPCIINKQKKTHGIWYRRWKRNDLYMLFLSLSLCQIANIPHHNYSSWTVATSPSIHLVPSFSLSVLFLHISCSLSLGLCCRPSGSARECLDGRLGIYTIGVPIRLFTFGGIPVSPVVTAVEEDVVESSIVLGSLTTST